MQYVEHKEPSQSVAFQSWVPQSIPDRNFNFINPSPDRCLLLEQVGSYSHGLMLTSARMWLPLTLAVMACGSEQLCPTGAGVTLAVPQHLSDPAEVCGGSLPLGSAGQRVCVCPGIHQGLLGLSPPYRSRWLLWNQWKSSSGSCRAMCGAGAGVCPNCPYTLPVCGLGPR